MWWLKGPAPVTAASTSTLDSWADAAKQFALGTTADDPKLLQDAWNATPTAQRADLSDSMTDSYWWKETALHRACSGGKVNVARWLVKEARATVAAKDKWGQSPLFYAAFNGQLACVTFLVDECKADIEGTDGCGWRPLHAAAFNNHASVVSFLMNRGATVTARTTKDQYRIKEDSTVLQVARERRCAEVLAVMDPTGVAQAAAAGESAASTASLSVPEPAPPPSTPSRETTGGGMSLESLASPVVGADPLSEWCRTNRFDRFEQPLRGLGVVMLEDLQDVTPQEFGGLGATTIEVKRFTRCVALLSAATEVTDSITRTAREAGAPIINPDELELGALIGQGSYGVVHVANWRGTRVAVKVLKGSLTDGSTQQAQAELCAEIQLMHRVGNHPHVASLLGISSLPHPTRLCIVSQLMEKGDLRSVLQRERPPLPKLVAIAAQVAAGVAHLHGQQVVHRDLAARNILIDERDGARVGDFGFSRVLQSSVGFTATDVGPIRWMAPESLSRHEYSPASDTWSFGVIMFEMVTYGEEPWAGESYAVAGAKTIRGETLASTVPPSTDPGWLSIMSECWAFQASARPSMLDVAARLRAYEAVLGTRAAVPRASLSASGGYDSFSVPTGMKT